MPLLWRAALLLLLLQACSGAWAAQVPLRAVSLGSAEGRVVAPSSRQQQQQRQPLRRRPLLHRVSGERAAAVHGGEMELCWFDNWVDHGHVNDPRTYKQRQGPTGRQVQGQVVMYTMSW